VLAISCGDSFRAVSGIERRLWVCLRQLLEVLVGKPLLLLRQSMGPFKRTLRPSFARKTLRKARLAESCDRRGVRNTSKMLGTGATESRVQFSPDVAFVMEPVHSDVVYIDGGMDRLLKDERPIVGLNVSGLLYMGGYNHQNMFGLKNDYKTLIHDLVRFFIN